MATHVIYCRDCAGKGVETIVAIVEGAHDVAAAVAAHACTPCFAARCADSVPADPDELAPAELDARARKGLTAKLGPDVQASVVDALLVALPRGARADLAGCGPKDRREALARAQAACTAVIEVLDAVPADVAELPHSHADRGPRLAAWAKACCAGKFQP